MMSVPETARKAALAFGATLRYLFWCVDFPLAYLLVGTDFLRRVDYFAKAIVPLGLEELHLY